jgi:hypothetical protein
MYEPVIYHLLESDVLLTLRLDVFRGLVLLFFFAMMSGAVTGGGTATELAVS